MPSCKAVLCHCYYSDILSLYIVMLLSISFTECQGDHVLTLLASERGSPFEYQEDFTFLPSEPCQPGGFPSQVRSLGENWWERGGAASQKAPVPSDLESMRDHKPAVLQVLFSNKSLQHYAMEVSFSGADLGTCKWETIISDDLQTMLPPTSSGIIIIHRWLLIFIYFQYES